MFMYFIIYIILYIYACIYYHICQINNYWDIFARFQNHPAPVLPPKQLVAGWCHALQLLFAKNCTNLWQLPTPLNAVQSKLPHCEPSALRPRDGSTWFFCHRKTENIALTSGKNKYINHGTYGQWLWYMACHPLLCFDSIFGPSLSFYILGAVSCSWKNLCHPVPHWQ